MPFKDPERRKQAAKDWRKKNTPEYHQWLYARRKLRFWVAESAREIIEVIAETSTPYEDTKRVAIDWLEEVERREKEIGNAFDHERNVPVWLNHA